MELQTIVIPATGEEVRYSGSGEFNITAGKNLRIETSPGGQDILNREVPNGKKWTVKIEVLIKETEA